MRTLLLLVYLTVNLIVSAADTVIVSNVQQLIDSIQSNRVLILESGEYHLNEYPAFNGAVIASKGNEIPLASNVSYSNGEGITIRSVENLTIKGKDGNKELVHIVGSVLEDYVFTVFNSSAISFVDISLTHDESVNGTISGGLIKIQQSNSIRVSNCDLLGRASNGVFCWRSKDIVLSNCTIQNCSYGIVDLRDSWTIKFNDCSFVNNKTCQNAWYMSGCIDVKVINSSFEDNHSRESHICERTKMFSFVRCQSVEFMNNQMKGNEFNYLGEPETIQIVSLNSDLKKNKFK